MLAQARGRGVQAALVRHEPRGGGAESLPARSVGKQLAQARRESSVGTRGR
jgi:hypothetical protein